MSAADASAPPPAFSPRTVLALVLVGVVAFAGLAVLAAYAPELRKGDDGRAHALSRSAVGYAGAPILLKGLGLPVFVSRSRASHLDEAVVVLTPEVGTQASALERFAEARNLIIVLPKWIAAPDPLKPGQVKASGMIPAGKTFEPMLKAYSKTTELKRARLGPAQSLRGAGGPFGPDTRLPLGGVAQLQAISGEGWVPALVDAQGRTVLAYARGAENVWVLADPDLLNNQGLARLANARAAAAILGAAYGGEGSIVFDVTLNGLERTRGLGRLMLEPPFLAATLCGLAAAALMGAHALARFGQPRRRGRAFALGARALVDNSADLVRMARKEHELAPAYAALTSGLVAQAAGTHQDPDFLEHLAQRRGAASPAELAAAAQGAKTRDDLLAVARRLYQWRGEMTRERR